MKKEINRVCELENANKVCIKQYHCDVMHIR